ncbi:MAG: hypothetical protein H6765_11135 [Candidatus Peribacteria bacterium]|nr:MAG: hypothetical protein H6765_11135 [Candidatus Peribacteria bacterium]
MLHDIDRDHIGKDAAEHLGGEFEQIVAEVQLPELLIADIRSHYHESTGVPVNSLLRKYLASVDELTGFVYAYSLMRPNGLEGMEAKSIIKKVKDKSFAAGVDRAHLRNCETFLQIPLAEFVPGIIEALQTYQA